MIEISRSEKNGGGKIKKPLSKIAAAAAVCLTAWAVYAFLPASCPESARRTAFIFVFAALFWGFEIIPLYATSVLAVLFLIFLLALPAGMLGFSENISYRDFLDPLASPVIMLFLGGFILAEALRKHRIDCVAAHFLLKEFGSKPFSIMLGFMFVTAFLSMWISNTATTAMMLAMISPFLAAMDHDDPFRPALALSIAFAANIGGIATPVGTPPNAIVLGLLAERGIRLHFLSWMLMAVPLAVILIAGSGMLLRVIFKPKYAQMSITIEKPQWEKGSSAVLIIAGATVCMWLTSVWHKIPESVIALAAMGGFVVFGLINREDLKKLDWDVLILMWGGLALGKGMEISRLADWILQLSFFEQKGFVLIIVFCLTAALISTFISNTATANLIVPLALSASYSSPVTLAVAVTLCCSLSMAMPISTPPNAMIFASGVVTGRDLFKSGVLISVLSILMIFIGFEFIIKRVF